MYIKLITVKITTGPSRALASTVYFRDGMTIPQWNKWEWYFRYREALIRIQNPKWYTSLEFIAYDPDPRTAEEILAKRQQDKIRAAKAQITKIQNAIGRYRSEYNELFPIEDDKIYIKLHIKLMEAEENLKKLES